MQYCHVLLLDIETANCSLFFFSNDDIQNCVIYLCATMWHETYDEMLKILTSMFRLVAGLVGSLNRAIRPLLIFEICLKILITYLFGLVWNSTSHTPLSLDLCCSFVWWTQKGTKKINTFRKASAVSFVLLPPQVRSLSRQSRSTA